jgi:acyl carrier protein phosphodiesterase
MNFLAHLALVDGDAPSRIGAILPDLVRGRLPDDLHPRVRAAALHHRRVDAFTDTHPLVATSVTRLRPACGRYSGIVVDVLYDHLLAADFERWHGQPLRPFVDEVYAQFSDNEPLMPSRMRLITQRMIEQDWLGSYVTIQGIAQRLAQMSARFAQRFGREVNLLGAIDTFDVYAPGLRADFDAFYPQLRDAVAQAPPRGVA